MDVSIWNVVVVAPAGPVPDDEPGRQGEQGEQRQLAHEHDRHLAAGKADHPQRGEFALPL